MSTKKNTTAAETAATTPETVSETLSEEETASAEETAAAVSETASGEETTAAETAQEPVFPDPCVYCGPSVRGVARQFTTYVGGVPEALKAFVRQHPAAKGLIVSTERFPAVRARLNKAGSTEAILFRKIKSEL